MARKSVDKNEKKRYNTICMGGLIYGIWTCIFGKKNEG